MTMDQQLDASSVALVCAVPCIVVGPSLAKHVLALLRAAKWHPKGHGRLVLDQRPEHIRSSKRAFQVCDSAVDQIEELLADSAVLPSDRKAQLQSPATSLIALIESNSVEWQPLFQLHEYIVDPNRCDIDGGLSLPPQTIQFLEAQDSPARPVESSSCMTSKPFKFVELFAGIGGFGVALSSLGGRCVLASEINPWAVKIYRRNFVDTEVCGNIRHSKTLPQHDILTGGFPCQPFTSPSGAPGKSALAPRPRGFRDSRGQLFWHIIRLLRSTSDRPKAILLENVTGLVANNCVRLGAEDASQDSCSALSVVLMALSSCGYRVSWREYDASMLVPQTRKRVFLVGIRSDIASASSFSWPQLQDLRRSIAQILHSPDSDGVEPHELERLRLSAAEWQSVSSTQYFQKHRTHRLPPLAGVSNTIRGSYRSGFKLYSQFVPFPVTSASNADAVPFRFFSPRECARLQGFPDSFELPSEVPAVSQYQAVGNAVVPPLIQEIAKAILAVLP